MTRAQHQNRFRAAMADLVRFRARSANSHLRTVRNEPSLTQLTARALRHPSPNAVERLADAATREKRPTLPKVEAVAAILELGYGSTDPMAEAEAKRAAKTKPRRPRAPRPAKERLKARHVQF